MAQSVLPKTSGFLLESHNWAAMSIPLSLMTTKIQEKLLIYQIRLLGEKDIRVDNDMKH